MHPRISELIDHLDQQRTGLRAAVNEIPADKHATIPPSGGWSVLGVLEHLATIDGRVAALLKKRIDDERAAGLGRETDASPILPTMDLARLVDRTTKLEAPPPLHPRGGRDLAASWLALDESRAALRAVIADADGLDLGRVMHPHLYFGPLNAYEWIGFVGAHERRHTDQIREIGASLAGVD